MPSLVLIKPAPADNRGVKPAPDHPLRQKRKRPSSSGWRACLCGGGVRGWGVVLVLMNPSEIPFASLLLPASSCLISWMKHLVCEAAPIPERLMSSFTSASQEVKHQRSPQRGNGQTHPGDKLAGDPPLPLPKGSLPLCVNGSKQALKLANREASR